jgi:hypothetical protein
MKKFMQKDLSKAPIFVNRGAAWHCGILGFTAIAQIFVAIFFQWAIQADGRLF